MKKNYLFATMLATGFAVTTMAQDYKWQAFYTQTYENVAQVADVWFSPSNQGGLSLAEADGNHYVYYDHGSANSRGLYNLDALTAEMYEGLTEYRIEFDLALTPGSDQNTSFNVGSPDIQTMGSDWATPCGNITKYPNNGLGSGSLFSLIQEGANNNSWRVYSQNTLENNLWLDSDYPIHITLSNDVFYHFAITVTAYEATAEEGWDASVQAEVTDMEGNPVPFLNSTTGEETMSVTLPYCDEGGGTWFKQFYVLSGRYKSIMKIDNVQVMKKVDANSVTPPTLSMTGVQMEGRVIALECGGDVDELISYYAVVDEDTYNAAEDATGLQGTEYTAPFVVSATNNYILAWNVNESGRASELCRFTCEAGWAPQLNAPTIAAIDYSGYKKTFQATCDQSNVKPLAPVSYTIYMSADSINWTEGNTYTVTSGNVYAKVEADGYAPAGCAPAEAPEGAYGSSKWTVAGMVISSNDCILEETGETHLNFGNSGKGRVHLAVEYWSEDYASEDGNTVYDANAAWAPLKKNGMHFMGGAGDMFILGSGNANGFTVNGIAVYNSNKGYIKIDNLTEGDIIQVGYADGSAQVLKVADPETFTVPIPKYGGAALASISIKGAGTVEMRESKVGQWGILSSSRTVADVEHSGATFYDHVYTIYNSDNATDSLLLKPVNSLVAGAAYIYYSTAEQIELITLTSEEPVDEQPREQYDLEMGTLIPAIDEPYEDTELYTMQPGGILMNNESNISVPEGSGCFQGLAEVENYNEVLDYKLQAEYINMLNGIGKYLEDCNKMEWYEDEEGNSWPVEKPEVTYEEAYAKLYADLLSKYVVVPVLHKYDQSVVDAITRHDAAHTVNVVTLSGITVRRGVKAADALRGLQHGLYIVGGRKIAK